MAAKYIIIYRQRIVISALRLICKLACRFRDMCMRGQVLGLRMRKSKKLRLIRVDERPISICW